MRFHSRAARLSRSSCGLRVDCIDALHSDCASRTAHCEQRISRVTRGIAAKFKTWGVQPRSGTGRRRVDHARRSGGAMRCAAASLAPAKDQEMPIGLCASRGGCEDVPQRPRRRRTHPLRRMMLRPDSRRLPCESGSSIATVVPNALVLSMEMLPPCAAAIRRAIASPSPVPSGFVENNGSPARARTSGLIPAPWSRTVTVSPRGAVSNEGYAPASTHWRCLHSVRDDVAEQLLERCDIAAHVQRGL